MRALAEYAQIAPLAQEIEKTFNFKMSAQAIEKYDASRVAGKNLSAPLRKLFWETRKTFLENVEQIPIANASVRLKMLQDQYEKASLAGKIRDAAFVVSIAQHEIKVMQAVEVDENGTPLVTSITLSGASGTQQGAGTGHPAGHPAGTSSKQHPVPPAGLPALIPVEQIDKI